MAVTIGNPAPPLASGGLSAASDPPLFTRAALLASPNPPGFA
jgi:hypothetical protein